MENNTTNHITDTSSVNLKTTNEKIQRNYAEFNQSWGRFNDIIKQVKQECLERVTNLEHENSVLQQRYKELEERVLPLTTSLNEQEYLKEFLKFLCASQINTNMNLTETQNGDSKNSDAIEQLTSLLLYTNITQKDILMNCHQLHQRVAQLEQINSILCSIICDGGFISSMDKIRTTDYGNSSSNQTQTTGEEHSTPGDIKTRLKLSDIFCKINDSLKSFGISSNPASHSYFHDSIKENHEFKEAFLPVHTPDNTEMNSINDSSNNNANNLFHSTLNSSNNSPTRQSTSNNNTIDVQNLSHDLHGYTYPTNCTIQSTGLYLNKDLIGSCSSTFTGGLQLNKNPRSHNIQEKNSITGEWIRSKSLPVLAANSQQTNNENESCLRTNSLTQLIHLPALFPISSYPIKRVTEQMMLLSENLLKSETEFDILKSSHDSNLPCRGHLTSDLIPNNNTQQNTTVWLDKPLPKGWIQLQNLPYIGLQRETIGTHSHMILGARSLPLLFNKPIESWKKASTTNISSSPLSLASGENYRMNSHESVHSFRNLHSNGFHHLKTIVEVDSGPPSFHELLSQSVHSNHNDNHNNKHESHNHSNNSNNNNNNSLQNCDHENVVSTGSPNVYISPHHSIEFLPNSRQILCRDQKLRYHYPLRSAVIGSNPEASNHFHIPKSYDLETQTNYHDAFRKLRNARKNLRFGVFSDTELLTGKFTITSTDDSAIDSGDDDFHSSVDSLYVKSFLTKSEVKTTTDSYLTTNTAQNNSQNNRIIPAVYASGSYSNLNCRQDIPPTNGDINEVKGEEDSQYAHTEHELNTSHVQNQTECNNSLKNIPNGKHDIEDDRKQIVNIKEPCNIPKCQKESSHSKTSEDCPPSTQSNTRATVPPPVVIYRRRFQKLASKRISKFSGQRKSENSATGKSLEEIKSLGSTAESAILTSTTASNSNTISNSVNNTTTTINNHPILTVKQTQMTSLGDNNPSKQIQSTKQNFQIQVSPNYLKESEQIEQSGIKSVHHNDTVDKLNKITNNSSIKTLNKPQQIPSSKTLSSSSCSSSSCSSSSTTSSLQQSTKIKLPQVDIHQNSTGIKLSSTKSSTSIDTKGNTGNKSSTNEQSNIKSPNHTYSPLPTKPINVNKSTPSSTLTSPEIRRLKNTPNSSIKSPISTTPNSLKNSRLSVTRSLHSHSSPASPISINSNFNTSRVANNNKNNNNSNSASLSSTLPTFDSKLGLSEKMTKSSIPLSSSTSPTVIDSSLKRLNKIINKPKVSSEKLHRRISSVNEITECDKLMPNTNNNAPPPIPPRTTSRSHTYQGKMVILKPKCLSVTNSPYTSNSEETWFPNSLTMSSANSSMNSTKNSINFNTLKMHTNTAISPSEFCSANGIKYSQNNLQNETLNDVSSISPQWKQTSPSKIATYVTAPYKRSSDVEIPRSVVTSPTLLPPSLSSSSLIPHDSITYSPKNIVSKSNESNRNSCTLNSFDNLNDINQGRDEQSLKNYSTNYYNSRTVDNNELRNHLNSTTTITTAVTPIKSNGLNELVVSHHPHSHPHQHQYIPHLQRQPFHPNEYPHQHIYQPSYSHPSPIQYHHHHHHPHPHLHPQNHHSQQYPHHFEHNLRDYTGKTNTSSSSHNTNTNNNNSNNLLSVLSTTHENLVYPKQHTSPVYATNKLPTNILQYDQDT